MNQPTKTKRYIYGNHRFAALPWTSNGASKMRFSSLISEDAIKSFRSKAAEMCITQIDLLESLARSLDQPEVNRAILEQLEQIDNLP